MYAVIKTGGKQYRVAEGDRLKVELLGDDAGDVSFTPILVVDGDVLSDIAVQEDRSRFLAVIHGESANPNISSELRSTLAIFKVRKWRASLVQ